MDGCVFCEIASGSRPAAVVMETDEVVAFLDARPVFKGHALVVPRSHIATLPDLPDELVLPYVRAVRAIAAAMPEAYGCQGTFVAANNVVSQSVPHLHVHVVPRTKGDGLRGFFWPRTRYASDDEAETYAAKLRAVL